MQTTVSRRQQYKQFLENVPLLHELTEYEVCCYAATVTAVTITLYCACSRASLSELRACNSMNLLAIGAAMV
jgi:hypothetical protein